MGSNTKNSVVVLLLTLVTILLTSVNARNATSITQPPTPPTPLPSVPSPPSPPRNASLAKPQPKTTPPRGDIPKAQPKATVHIYFSRPTVTGVVYCNCPRFGRPLYGAKVQLKCRRFRFLKKKKTVTTSFSGRFYATLPWWAKRSSCKVTLKYAPRHSRCRYKSNLNRGISGASLRGGYRNRYTVGPFSFTTSPYIKCYK